MARGWEWSDRMKAGVISKVYKHFLRFGLKKIMEKGE